MGTTTGEAAGDGLPARGHRVLVVDDDVGVGECTRFILTQGGPGVSTQTIVMFVYNQGWQFLTMGLASAAGWVLFVIIMGITAIQFVGQRKWVNYDI